MLTHDDLKILAAVTGPCVTIFEPLRGGTPSSRRPNGMAAAVRKVDQLLTDKGFNPAERAEMLGPIRKVASNTDGFGRKGSLVVFRAPGYTAVHFGPEVLAPRARFAEEFLLLPLLPGILSRQSYWLLSFSINAVHLYRGSGETLTEVVLPQSVPTSLAAHEAFDQPDHSLRGRVSAGRSVGRMKGVQFGTSIAHELQADYLHDFFKAIDRGIHPILTQDPQPLIIAAVPRELAIYRKANTYPRLLAGAIHGNVDFLGHDTLREKAAKLMSECSAMAMEATRREMEDAANRGRLINDPAAIVAAAYAGRVEELIVPGVPESGHLEDLINVAALATIRNSGRVCFLNDGEITSGVAAIVRFPQDSQVDGEADEVLYSPASH